MPVAGDAVDEDEVVLPRPLEVGRKLCADVAGGAGDQDLAHHAAFAISSPILMRPCM